MRQTEIRMTSRINSARRNCHSKFARVLPSESCDSESETAVTSTSGQVKPQKPPVPRKRPRTGSPATPKLSKVAKAASVPKVQLKGGPSKSRQHPGVLSNVGVQVKTQARANESSSVGSGERLLMREWLINEVALKKIDGLKWMNEDKRLISIPWIHASKEGWSRDHHCKLFERWAIYTGKYDPAKDKPDTKRWKANFRCALNSLPDVKEVQDMSQKNGMNGFKVYELLDPVTRKGHPKHRPSNRTLTSKSQDQTAAVDRVSSNQKSSKLPSTLKAKSVNSSREDIFTDSFGNPITLKKPDDPALAVGCSAELIRDTVPPYDGYFTSISAASIEDNFVIVTCDNLVPTALEPSAVFLTLSAGNPEQDIISLRNVDHNYFRAQIPTTVENFEDEDSLSPIEAGGFERRNNTSM